jgi:gamma-glutamylcyclotransferase
MTQIYYFAYGVNAVRSEMAERCPNAQWAGTATLPNHALRFRVHADVEPFQNDRVYGALWILDDTALVLLDQYEGYPHYYDRKMVQIWQDGEPIAAMIYHMVDQSFQDLPHREYLSRVRSGYEQCNIPADQLDRALANIELDPQWDPIFRRIKISPEREFKAAIMKAEYYDG